MKPSDADIEQVLAELLDRTVKDFGPTALWNIPAGLPTRVRAKAVYAGIAKHGGSEGMRRAIEIRKALAMLGETPWR